MNLWQFVPILAFLSLGSCSDFPRDPDSTLERIRTERSFNVGLVASADGVDIDPLSRQLLLAIGRETRASPRLAKGETEVLLTRLEEGQLDIVIGQFDRKSPWATRVSFGPPLSKRRHGKSELVLRPAMKNGENGWITLIERHARDLVPSAQ